jgi:prepilin signal peptidase PulO-like enzyme (type II secretory pathway)
MSGGISLVAFVGGVLLGSLAGLLLHRFVSWLLCEIEIAEGTQDSQIDCLRKSIAQYRILTMAACCFVTVGIIWWEVICHRLLPGNVVGPSVSSPALFVRALGHILFFWFLAAAAWVDIRYRVIPDVITTPGVLCGLVALVIFPGILLPIPVITERSFAPATLTADFLVAWGALNNSKAVESSISHVGATMALFLLWWAVCTAAWTQQNNEYSRAFVPRVIQIFREPRNLTLLFGITVLAFANWWGGLRLAAAESGMIGLTISAGVVWFTRIGASIALGREAMGMGDVTLMAMVGVWLGWQPAVIIFFLATLIGLGHGIFQLVMHRENELPFGPSLCLAAALVTLFWQPVWAWASVLFDDVVQLGTVLGLVVVLTAVTLFLWRWLREKLHSIV